MINDFSLKCVKEICIVDIILMMKEFVYNNDIFDQEEDKEYNAGLTNAYDEMLIDIETQNVDEFVKKYVKKMREAQKQIDEKLETNFPVDERIVGYNNAIGNVLALVNPYFTYGEYIDRVEID